MSDWQPIETAPKDGTPLLLYVPDPSGSNHLQELPNIIVGMWGETNTHFGGATEPGAWISDLGYIDSYEETGAFFEPTRQVPTHWMPMPQPPTDATS